MKIKWVFAIILLSLLFAGQLHAQSVYFWTDENGVRHYSNTGIPQGVQEADVRPEEASPSPAPEPADTADTDIDRDAPADTPAEGEEGEPAPGSPEEGADERLAERVAKERERLESEIKRIKNLSIGKSFTQGMKDAQLRPLEEQLALLDADPKRYFRMKRQGAFSSSSDGGDTPASPTEPAVGRLSSEGPRSSTGLAAGDESATPPQQESEEPSEEESDTEDKRSGRARSSGSAESRLFPED